MDTTQKAQEIIKNANYDTNEIFELAVKLLEEINFHREAEAIKKMADDEIED